jgi:hypothetical protein
MAFDNREIYDNEERRRINEEVIIVNEERDEDTPFVDDLEEPQEDSLNPLTMITTGKILPNDKLPYFRYLIIIAVMCFFSIFLTFMSLNANREYRQREKYALVLHERSVLKEEERYSLSSKQVVTARLKSHGIELVDLSKESRLIEK